MEANTNDTKTTTERLAYRPDDRGARLRSIVVLGCGAAGTLAANRLRGRLDPARFAVVAVDRTDHQDHELQLLVGLGLYGPHSLRPPEDRMLRGDVEFRHAEAGTVDVARRELCLADGTTVPYDVLVVATGRTMGSARADGLPALTGAECVVCSPGLGDEQGFVPVEARTRQSPLRADVFAVGGAAGGAALSGAARHAEVERLVDGVRRYLDVCRPGAEGDENSGPRTARGRIESRRHTSAAAPGDGPLSAPAALSGRDVSPRRTS